jgi:HSP20 family molecular chaperone IbpA
MDRKGKKQEYVFYWDNDNSQQDEQVLEEIDSMDIDNSVGNMNKSIPVNIGETNDEVIVKAKIPGVSRDEIELKVTEDSMDIAVERYGESIEEDDNGYKEEISTNSVRRFFTFPVKVDRQTADAKLKNGILTIRIKKLKSN